MFAQRLVTEFRRAWFKSGRERRVRSPRADVVTEQVKQVLQTADQKLILMVRG